MKRNLARSRLLILALLLPMTIFGAGAGLLACSADDGKPSGPIIVVGPRDAASNTAVDAGVDSGKKPLAADCTDNPDCESGTCFKGTRSSYCTLTCTADNAIEVCAGVFGGTCNQQGFCRRPN